MALKFDNTAAYNPSTTHFLAVEVITDRVIQRALSRYDAHWFVQLTERFGRSANGRSLPPVFNLKKNASGSKSFSMVRVDAVIRALDACEDATPSELVAMLRSTGRGEDFASVLLGNTLQTVFEALYNRVPATTLFQDMREIYACFCRQNVGDTALKFVEMLTDFDQVRHRGVHLANAYSMLVALYSEDVLLHPFGLWRAIYPGSGEGTPQKYMEGVMNEQLLKSSRSRDFRVVSGLVDETLSSKPQILRTMHCLLLATQVRLANLDPKHVLACVNEYLADDRLKVRPQSQRLDTRKTAVYSINLLAKYLVESGNQDAIKMTYPNAVIDARIARKMSGSRGDGKFRFLAEAGFQEWSTLLAAYLQDVPVSRINSALSPILVFADWLIEHGGDILRPEEFRRPDAIRLLATKRKVPFKEYLADRFDLASARPSAVFGQTRLFLEWYRRERNEEYKVPLLSEDQPDLPEYAGKTTKEALPARIIETMKGILAEDNWAWSRNFDADNVVRFNTTTDVAEATWCPVRAMALYIMLWVPIRSIQIRLLDSGEFDEFQFSPKSRSFVRNRVGIKGRRLGVFREYADLRGDEKRYIGLYINTNKTQRIYSASKRQGYEIKWERWEVLQALLDVRDWQETYNPLYHPIHVNTLQDSTLHAPETMGRFIPPYAFLFRDAASNRVSAWEPISYSRLNTMFLELCAETERRLQAKGVPVKLIDQWEKRADGRLIPTASSVTLHSLRVSGITNFAEFGVPLNILTEFIAGHSSIFINLWYQKFGFSTISSIIDQASNSAVSPEGLKQFQNWIDDRLEGSTAQRANKADDEDELGEEEDHPLRELFVGGSIEALNSLRSQTAGMWHLDIDGLCPNGRTMCHEGGPRIGTKGGTRNTPVAGGPGNCPRCRFWVTGPMFMFGQIVKLNVLLYHIRELGLAQDKLHDDLDDCQAPNGPVADAERRIARLRSAIEVYDDKIENSLHSWVKRYEYAVRSAKLLQEGEVERLAPGQAHQLVTSENNSHLRRKNSKVDLADKQPPADQEDGVVRLSLTECHPLELLEFVAQACEVIPVVDASSVHLRKSALLDKMLDREGINPLFFKLSEEDAMRAGNALTRFLAGFVDQQGVSKLLSGEATLAELGLTFAFQRGLAFSLSGLSPTQPNNFFQDNIQVDDNPRPIDSR